jgi:hypothetical protein
VKRLYGLLIAIAALFVFAPLAAAISGDADGDEHPTQRWDQHINTTSRFAVLSAFGGAAVRDNETGLVWEQSPTAPDTFTWLNAQFHCNGLSTGKRLGWRLPTLQELASLVDPTVLVGPTLPSGHPFSNVQSGKYWSATTNADVTGDAWIVQFNLGNVGYQPQGDLDFVWCVRGGQGSDPQ